MNLERGLTLGAVLLAGGVALNAWLFSQWLGRDLEPLDVSTTLRTALWGFLLMVIGVQTSAQQTKPAHLVTPELEAHCQRILHKDGMIILEGNVLLLCKKHAQPIRIEAPRVMWI